MDRFKEHSNAEVSPNRLLDAADTILRAAAQEESGVCLIDLWTGTQNTAPAHAFTPDELIEGMLFLFRMGLVEQSPNHSPGTRR